MTIRDKLQCLASKFNFHLHSNSQRTNIKGSRLKFQLAFLTTSMLKPTKEDIQLGVVVEQPQLLVGHLINLQAISKLWL
jgi:hypothetical protein